MSADGDAIPHIRKARGQGHERRAEILAAAKALFAEEGYQAFTTRKLAARVGLSQTGLYVYFGGKDEIFDALCQQSFEELAVRFRGAEAAAAGGLETLRALAQAYVAFGLEHPDEYRLTFMEGPGLIKADQMSEIDPAAPPDQLGIASQVFLMLRGQLQRLADAGALRKTDVTVATHSLWFGLHGLVSVFIARPAFVKSDRGQLVGGLIETLVAGLRA